MVFNLKMAPKWQFDVDINGSADPTKWILKYERGGSQERGVGIFGESVLC
jgi:hypothetical protein